ncbi:MAG TPA: flagellin [Bryobacteraceae bacterium]|nr:flagellin [Bryobacteraceae bacterium]
MSISIQTNVTSLFAQQALAQNSTFESKTIQQLTSGYRINSSGDDAAGLAVANLYRSQIAELTQGVRNANDGTSVFQTIDGGLNNISQILDRLRTLATQSASATFAGDRSTLNNEFQSQLAEINRQAANIGLNTGGKYNTQISVYIGGASTAANAVVKVDLSGANNGVDATALGLAGTSVAGGGVSLTGNTVRLDDSAVSFLASGSQTFTFNVAGPTGAASTVVATLNGGSSGLSGNQVISALNTQLSSSGITASIGSNGQLQFSGSVAFTLGAVGAATAGNAVVTTGSTIATNSADYNINSAFATIVGTNETLTFQNANGSYNVSLPAGNAAATIQALNTQLSGSGISAVLGSNGTDINIQSANAFSVNQTAAAGTSGGLFAGTGAQTVNAPSASASSTGNATAALTALTNAVTALGLVQGRVGTGENVFANAINLANSQITNLSSSQSVIRDADVAAAAANLTKAQTLIQSSIAALAQANALPAAVLKLLQ